MTTDVALLNLLAWSLQTTAVVCAGGALPRLLRLDAPGVRHGYWRVLLLACLLLPVVQPWRAPAATMDIAPFELSGIAPVVTGQATPGAVRPSFLGWRTFDSRILDLAAIVLVAGATIRLGWLALGLVRLRRMRRRGVQPAVELTEDELGTLARAGAEVRYVSALRQPITFGAWRPIVLLPEGLRGQPAAVRQAVLVHELWHVRRRDWLWVVLEEAVRALFWFHPAIAWLVSRVQSSREEVVDELTVLTTNARRTYIEALLLFADEPGIYPATAFARRCHLFQRVLLISKEAMMSSRRIVLSCAAMAAVVVCGGWSGVAAFPLRDVPQAAPAAQAQPRDLRPGEPRPPLNREAEIRRALSTSPPSAALYLELARLQEARGAAKEAEATLVQARTTFPAEQSVVMELSGFYNRAGQFDQTVETLEQAASMASSDPKAQHLVATFYEEKVRKDATLSPGDRLRYIQAGVAAENRALQLSPDYVDAMIVKNILLRHQANGEANASSQAVLIQQADALRNRAIELQKSRQLLNSQSQPTSVPAAGVSGRMPPPPPPPPPPPGPAQAVDGQAPVRVGGAIKVPTKLVNVPPVYPEEAKASRVQGVVIIEAVIDSAGAVRETHVLRSIPLLDDAATDAVKQWQFVPTLLNGTAVPVIMTVTVNFTLQ